MYLRIYADTFEGRYLGMIAHYVAHGHIRKGIHFLHLTEKNLFRAAPDYHFFAFFYRKRVSALAVLHLLHLSFAKKFALFLLIPHCKTWNA